MYNTLYNDLSYLKKDLINHNKTKLNKDVLKLRQDSKELKNNKIINNIKSIIKSPTFRDINKLQGELRNNYYYFSESKNNIKRKKKRHKNIGDNRGKNSPRPNRNPRTLE